MTDRRFTIQADPRGINTMKMGGPTTGVRDDIQAPLTSTGATLMNPAAGTTSNVPERRPSQSVFRRLSMSLGNSRKSSMFLLPNQPRPNTYRMEPENEYRFRPYKLQAKILEVLVEQMKDQTYNPATVNELVKDVSRSVHQLVKNFQLPRYKLIIQTVIVQKYEQVLRIGSRCLWDSKTDNMVSVHYEANDMIAIVNVYAVYFE